MNTKYNSYLINLNNLSNLRSLTYEDSLLYQKEVLDYATYLDKLNDNYFNILIKISNIKNKYSENNFVNIFENLKLINTDISVYNDQLTEFKEKINTASKAHYDDLTSRFNTNLNEAKSLLGQAKNYLDNYNRYSYSLSSLNPNAENYSLILSKKNETKNNFYDKINTLPSLLTKLEEILNKGLKKMY